MARRKNTKRFDPRYFMDEKLEEQYVQGADHEATSAERALMHAQPLGAPATC